MSRGRLTLMTLVARHHASRRRHALSATTRFPMLHAGAFGLAAILAAIAVTCRALRDRRIAAESAQARELARLNTRREDRR